MRRRHLHRPIASLALVAMLLLSILPTLGRLAGEGTAPAVHAGTVLADALGSGPASMVHMSHLAHATHAAHGRPSAPAAPPSHDGHGSHDCPYCPLLAGLAFSPVPPGMPSSPGAARTVAWFRTADLPIVLRTSSLGSRGPPAMEG
jgi:hypothetical protein